MTDATNNKIFLHSPTLLSEGRLYSCNNSRGSTVKLALLAAPLLLVSMDYKPLARSALRFKAAEIGFTIEQWFLDFWD